MVFHTFESTLMGGLTLKQMSEDVFDVTDPDVYAISCHNLTMKEKFDELAQTDSMENTRIMDAPSDIIKTDPLESDRIKIDRMIRETPNVSLFRQQVKLYIDSEVKGFEKTAEASLDRTLASVAVILGHWAAGAREQCVTRQHVSTFGRNATTVKLQEHILDAPTEAHLEGDPLWNQHNLTEFGLHKGNKSTNESLHGTIVTTKMLWEAMSPKQRWLAVLFGFVLPFSPTDSTCRQIETQVHSRTFILDKGDVRRR
ncbi:hypothetical protein SUNI508_09323 [Seiridium unicorne]|uniref:Uncharacterized protein n=1 Tax=Seiridium unicorne TaxID=138068 RepID=A0ABR2UQM6_9PEZI